MFGVGAVKAVPKWVHRVAQGRAKARARARAPGNSHHGDTEP